VSPNESKNRTLAGGPETTLRSLVLYSLVANNVFDERASEEKLLSFLIRHLSPTADPSDLQRSGDGDGGVLETRLDYWFAKYIGQISLKDKAAFQVVQKVAGIALLSEALLEIRNPSQSIKGKKDVLVYIDTPLMMDYLSLSGIKARENAAYTIDKLKSIGISLGCFGHSCDEIRDNLKALLDVEPPFRTGPTAEAIKSGEVKVTYVTSVKNNSVHYVKNVAKVQVLPQKLGQFQYAERFCTQTVYTRLRERMPQKRDIARERDASSLAVVMRRRGGHETRDFFDAKYVLLTSNSSLIRNANEVLRASGALSTDKSAIGPAIHHRIVAGLLFANAGLEDQGGGVATAPTGGMCQSRNASPADCREPEDSTCRCQHRRYHNRKRYALAAEGIRDPHGSDSRARKGNLSNEHRRHGQVDKEGCGRGCPSGTGGKA
jgi:hypothetical protein